MGFGPRFLHSTGQAYKGGPNSGVFLQITADDAKDLPVPGKRRASASSRRRRHAAISACSPSAAGVRCGCISRATSRRSRRRSTMRSTGVELKGANNAAWHDRLGADGREYHPPADAGRASDRRLRPRRPKPSTSIAKEGATGAGSLGIVGKLVKPRTVWVMLPAGADHRGDGERARPGCWSSGDVIIDGGNSFYKDDIRRAKALQAKRAWSTSTSAPPAAFGARARLLHDDRRRRAGGRAPRPDLRDARARDRQIRAPRAGRDGTPAPSRATSTPARPAPATSSRWSTTASNMA